MNLFLVAVAFLAQGATTAPAQTEIPFRTVGFGSNAKIKDGGAVVMRTDKSFDDYRKTMGTTAARKPVVEWGKEQIVAVHAAGVGYGATSLQINKVRKATDGSLEVEAYLEPGSQAAVPSPGAVRLLKKEGIYALIVVEKTTGEVTLKVVDPPKKQVGKSDKSG